MPAAEFLVRAVLFDMDGTLIDSTPAVDRAWAVWEQRWDVRLGVRASELGRPARDIVAERVPAADAAAAFLDIERLEVADTAGIVVLPGVRALLDALPVDRWAVATSCSAPLAAARLAATGIEPPVLVTASDTALGKPNPDPYLAAAERLGVAPRTASSSRTRWRASPPAVPRGARRSGCSAPCRRRPSAPTPWPRTSPRCGWSGWATC
ncbi:HAD family hydrolase [Amnibacterium soli]|uniref:HAD family hydrolase n=1 Tax=Amnibacterium soli TaxID=1282736 RepID=A0ABP8YZ41_9MICO